MQKLDALAALHFLNRRVKHPEYRHERFRVYEAKNKLLEALVLRGLATVETFVIERPSYYGAGRSTWYIVESEGFRFHQPEGVTTRTWREIAKRVEPHDPTQPVREIPDIGVSPDEALSLVIAYTASISPPLKPPRKTYFRFLTDATTGEKFDCWDDSLVSASTLDRKTRKLLTPAHRQVQRGCYSGAVYYHRDDVEAHRARVTQAPTRASSSEA